MHAYSCILQQLRKSTCVQIASYANKNTKLHAFLVFYFKLFTIKLND
uniref:Bm555 n=1 Tax=Brugia malayi TaxID=6279 RepID=A0A1I9GD35_BRUMA|nr:Bm555 [Brugia malayi]